MKNRDINGYGGKMEFKSGDFRLISAVTLKYESYLAYNLVSS